MLSVRAIAEDIVTREGDLWMIPMIRVGPRISA